MTMPTLIANHQKKQTATQLKKVYSVLNQAFKMAEAEHGEYENWTPISELNAEEYFNKYLKPYIKVLKLCNNYRECNYNNMSPWKFLNNEGCQAGIHTNNNSITFMMPDGTVILYMAFVNEGGYDTTHTIVDLNGPKGPNKFGRDVFRFDREKGKGFVPTTSNTNYCSINSNGVGCAQKIMEDGWEIAPNYPW